VIAISGFCALAYEVLWTRVLTLFLGSTTYAFTTMLSAFLCGIALGSFLLARFIDARKDLLTILGAVQIGIALSAILLIPVFGKLYDIGSQLTRAGWLVFGRFTLSFLVMLLPTILMGGTFPLVSKIYASRLESGIQHLGRSIGNVYSANTLGSILGSFLAGFILIPHIGIQRTIVIIAFINAAAGAMVAVIGATHPAPRLKSSVPRFTVLTAAIIVIIVASILIDVDKPLTRFTAIFKGPGEESKLLFYKEGVDASVTVVEDPQGVRRAFVDANQAAEDSRWDLPSHSVIGHLPILLHPDPKTALVIGFGMGVTSWSISRHGVQVDAIEISPGIVEANKYFSRINHNVLDDPLVNLIVDDGRNYALTTDKKYDVISTGIIHPLVSANSAGFYTMDFYELCKRILTPPSSPPQAGGNVGGGIMCQWVPLHRLPEEQYKMIIRTFKAAFPHTTLWYKYTPDFSILIGTQERLKIDYPDFRRRMEKESVRADLELVNMADPIALLDSFMMDEDTIDQYVGPGPLHTDNHPRMEFFVTQMGEYKIRPYGTTYPNLLGMSKFRKSILDTGYLTLDTGSGEKEKVEETETSVQHPASSIQNRLQQYFRATQYAIAGQLFYVKGDFENSMRQYRMASDVNPQDDNIEWLMSHVQKIMDDEAIQEYKEIVRVYPDSATAHAGLGLLYQRRGMIDEAIAEMETAVQLDPGMAVARINLSAMYQKKGMIDEAIEQLRALVETKSGSAVIHGRLGDLYMAKANFAQAEAEFKEALRLDPDMALAHYSLAVLYLQQGTKLDDALEYARRAVQLSDQAKFIGALARVYYEKMMYPDAESEIKRAISMEPDNESYRALLAEIQKKTGR
jgi:spermidine synthase